MINREHGSPFDRGEADSYYRRRQMPHKMVGNERVWLTPDSEEWKEYMEGYQINESIGNHQEW
jgi:hypothetical protein